MGQLSSFREERSERGFFAQKGGKHQKDILTKYNDLQYNRNFFTIRS